MADNNVPVQQGQDLEAEQQLQELAREFLPPEQQQAAPASWKGKIFGQDFEIKDPKQLEELLTEFAKQSTEQARRELAASAQRQPPQQAAPAPAPSAEKKYKDFDVDKLVRLVNDDPVEAWNYVDQVRYGGVNPVQAMQQLAQQVAYVRQQQEVLTFERANPDFNPQDQQALQALGQVMQQFNAPPTAQSLSAAWSVVKRMGQAQPQEQAQQAPRPTAPPTVSRSNSPEPAPINYNELSLEQIDAMLRKMGQPV